MLRLNVRYVREVRTGESAMLCAEFQAASEVCAFSVCVCVCVCVCVVYECVCKCARVFLSCEKVANSSLDGGGGLTCVAEAERPSPCHHARRPICPSVSCLLLNYCRICVSVCLCVCAVCVGGFALLPFVPFYLVVVSQTVLL
jgi:hypothetical protein